MCEPLSREERAELRDLQARLRNRWQREELARTRRLVQSLERGRLMTTSELISELKA
jgi:hypothetical protein